MRAWALIASAFALASAAFADPGLGFSPSRLDFGELGPVETAERAVMVENAGTAPVRILRVRACCGAKASMSVRELAPSSSAELRVSVTTGVKPGPFRKTVTVLSDDPARPMFSLAIVGSVRDTRPAAAVGAAETAAPSGASNPQPLPVSPAGSADGSRLCAFAIVASLAGLIAIVFPMAKRMSRNAVPVMAALGMAAALAGWLLWPRPGGVAPAADSERPEKSPGAISTAEPASAGAAKPSERRGAGTAKMSRAELAEGNERLAALLREPEMDPSFPGFLASAVLDRSRDEQWRNHCLQYVPECMLRLAEGSADRALLADVMSRAVSERTGVLAGTALLGYCRLSEKTGVPSAAELGDMAFAIASDASSSPENVVTALRVGAERKVAAMLPAARYWARNGAGAFVRSVAVSAVRDLGSAGDVEFLKSLLPARTKAEERSVNEAISRLEVSR